eukprot:CAMPEP_0175941254 /NCGR_PEP_ID=MMETSP0108-20121206/24290_1 /TAXON_ID=195067 ORGANISM="Goniomonas pacifica, Strain CCMP1869" /NCGR_SAMPLE_ID=MMETSP0108 /ASSEMBLY_ACC=CAM_ASM_000204 /LENGTH=46 /DNA_ID= /DNA_START= /DNA_END= /DNA_ORIENTATION=
MASSCVPDSLMEHPTQSLHLPKITSHGQHHQPHLEQHSLSMALSVA